MANPEHVHVRVSKLPDRDDFSVEVWRRRPAPACDPAGAWDYTVLLPPDVVEAKAAVIRAWLNTQASGGEVDVTLEEAAAMGVLSPADKDEWVIQAPSSVGWTPDEMAQIGRAVQAFQAGLPGLYRPIRLEATVLPDDGNARADG